MILRKARISDSIKIFQWRNDTITRMMSVNTRRISWASHEKWFNKALNNDKTILLIGQIEKKNDKSKAIENMNNYLDIGIVNFEFDESKSCFEISFNIDPGFRKNGNGKLIVKLGVNVIRKQFPKIKYISACSRNSNFASLNILTLVGFKVIKDSEYFKYFSLTIT